MAHRVVVLALDGVLPLDLGIPARVFDEACEPDGTRLYSVSTCSLGGRPVRTHEDPRSSSDNDESASESADTVAPWREGGQVQFMEHPVPQDTDRSTAATRQWVV
ncbi:hypothetical protein ACWC9S_25245 [Streptomyces xiamenensis]